MTLKKWNYDLEEYEDYKVPDEWNCKTISFDMSEVVNCPHCGKAITFGEGYTSREIQTEHGFGYTVCGKCSSQEFHREMKRRGVIDA